MCVPETILNSELDLKYRSECVMYCLRVRHGVPGQELLVGSVGLT